MCGIAGVLDLRGRPVDLEAPRAMAAVLAHRGPDGEGVWTGGPVGLAHRRLAVIDVEGGAQPMRSADGRRVIVYNGEVYNFPALRRALEAEGRVFRTRSDTEVVLESLSAWGERAVERFEGVFALACWDTEARTLLLARDPVGARPLYFAETGGRFLFASEIKALLAAGLRAEPDEESILQFLTFQDVIGERTFFRGVTLLPPGETLRVEADGRRARRRYFEVAFGRGPLPAEAYREALRERLEAAVEAQLVSDVPLGAFLSGGMDTTAILSAAVRARGARPAFCLGFEKGDATPEELFCDETSAARATAGALGCPLRTAALRRADFAARLPWILRHLDEPRLGVSDINDAAFRLAASEVKVVLSGGGGDEIFGGYTYRYEPVAAAPDARTARERLFGLLSLLFAEGAHRTHLEPTFLDRVDPLGPRRAFEGLWDSLDAAAPLDRALGVDFRMFLPSFLLLEDRLSMAHGIEVRVPLLDLGLVRLAAEIPGRWKVGGGVGKRILREALRGLVPDAVLDDARKIGFHPPVATWLAGPNAPFVRRVLLSPRALARGYVRPASIERTVERYLAREGGYFNRTWSLLALEVWHRLFIDGEAPEEVARA